jgi:hypothetical protein
MVIYHASPAGQLALMRACAWVLRRYANPKIVAARPHTTVRMMGHIRLVINDGCPRK